jgi:hypothetical protein
VALIVHPLHDERPYVADSVKHPRLAAASLFIGYLQTVVVQTIAQADEKNPCFLGISADYLRDRSRAEPARNRTWYR